jgi:hypothetical protein
MLTRIKKKKKKKKKNTVKAVSIQIMLNEQWLNSPVGSSGVLLF